MSPDGTRIAASSVDNTLRVFSLADGAAPHLICEAPAEEA